MCKTADPEGQGWSRASNLDAPPTRTPPVLAEKEPKSHRRRRGHSFYYWAQEVLVPAEVSMWNRDVARVRRAVSGLSGVSLPTLQSPVSQASAALSAKLR